MSYEVRSDNKGAVLLGSGVVSDVRECDRGLVALNCPEMTVEGTFHISDNRHLRSLKNGPRFAEAYHAAACDLTELDCAELVVQAAFNVSSNLNLLSLKGGPREVGDYYAKNCGLEALDCGELTVWRRFNVYNNPRLRSLRGCPRAATAEVDDDMALLFAVGRAQSIVVAADTVFPTSSLFRFKLDLVRQDLKINARFIKEE